MVGAAIAGYSELKKLQRPFGAFIFLYKNLFLQSQILPEAILPLRSDEKFILFKKVWM
jgi:hypothetical protein